MYDCPVYEVILDRAGERRLEVMRALRRQRPELTPAAAKRLVDQTPVSLGSHYHDQALRLIEQFGALGASVHSQPPLEVSLGREPLTIPEALLDRIRERRLVIDAPAGRETDAQRVVILKPAAVPGNALPQPWWSDQDRPNGWPRIEIDALPLELWGERILVSTVATETTEQSIDRWHVESQPQVLCVPGPTPGYFRNAWTTPEEALADVLDYYFGDPARVLDSVVEYWDYEAELAADTIDEPCWEEGCESPRVRFTVLCVRHFLKQ